MLILPLTTEGATMKVDHFIFTLRVFVAAVNLKCFSFNMKKASITCIICNFMYLELAFQDRNYACFRTAAQLK